MTFSAPRTITLSMEHDEITDRLRTLGEQPVPDATRTHHLHRMASLSAPAPKRFGRFAVAAAAIVGFFAGSTGLAMAGALPDPAQDVAHDVLSVVQVDVPEGTRGACVSAAAQEPGLDKAGKKAAKAACREGEHPGKGRSGSAPGQTKHATDPCRGKPPWAGKPAKTAEARAERETEKEEFRQGRAACPPDAGEDPAEAQREAADEAEEQQREAADEAEEQRREAEERQAEQQQQQAPAPPAPTPPAAGETPPVAEGGTPPVAEGETPPAAEGEEAPTEGT